MTRRELAALQEGGWRLTRDGSTATAYYAWDDPDDPDSGWEVLVLHTAGHGSRFSLNVAGDGSPRQEGNRPVTAGAEPSPPPRPSSRGLRR
jgi:hypothetical protein